MTNPALARHEALETEISERAGHRFVCLVLLCDGFLLPESLDFNYPPKTQMRPFCFEEVARSDSERSVEGEKRDEEKKRGKKTTKA